MENLKLTSPGDGIKAGFADGGEMPRKYGYNTENGNVSPPLTITGIPDGTKSLTLIMEDPDAEKCGYSRPYVHWVAYNIIPLFDRDWHTIPESIAGVAPITKVASAKMTNEERKKSFNEYLRKSYPQKQKQPVWTRR